MSGLEFNKIAAAILLSSLIAMLSGFVANVLYKPNIKINQRGYAITVTDDNTSSNNEAVKEEKFDIPELMKNANAELGREIAKKCISCHSFEKGGPNKVGPHLWNVAGRQKAHVDDYKFSAALTALGGSWDDESLFYFLHKPSKYAPGTKMSFIGLSKPEDIVNIIMFLKTVAHDNVVTR